MKPDAEPPRRRRRHRGISTFDRVFAVTLLCAMVTGVLGTAFALLG